MKKVLFLLFFLLVTVTSFADFHNYPCQSTSLVGGRYEIIQSPMVRACFFRLDKETGRVWQYTKNKDDKPNWLSLEVIGIEDDSLSVYKDKVNYQLFIGGIAAADVLLLNVNSGATYQLYHDTEEQQYFFALIFDGLKLMNYFEKRLNKPEERVE